MTKSELLQKLEMVSPSYATSIVVGIEDSVFHIDDVVFDGEMIVLVLGMEA